jgi:hypothetical protein
MKMTEEQKMEVKRTRTSTKKEEKEVARRPADREEKGRGGQ